MAPTISFNKKQRIPKMKEGGKNKVPEVETYVPSVKNSDFRSGSGVFDMSKDTETAIIKDTSISEAKRDFLLRKLKKAQSNSNSAVNVKRDEDGTLKWQWGDQDKFNTRKGGVADDDRTRNGIGGKGIGGISGGKFDQFYDYMVSTDRVKFNPEVVRKSLLDKTISKKAELAKPNVPSINPAHTTNSNSVTPEKKVGAGTYVPKSSPETVGVKDTSSPITDAINRKIERERLEKIESEQKSNNPFQEGLNKYKKETAPEVYKNNYKEGTSKEDALSTITALYSKLIALNSNTASSYRDIEERNSLKSYYSNLLSKYRSTFKESPRVSPYDLIPWYTRLADRDQINIF
jgi:hypothetical protein